MLKQLATLQQEFAGTDAEGLTIRRIRIRMRKLLRIKFAYLQANLPWSVIALSASTAKTVGSVQAAANQPLKILEASVSHDGATSTNGPAVVDFARCTFGTAGTATGTTPLKKDPGRAETIQTTGKTNYSAEPTTITPQWSEEVAQYNGLYHYITPQGAPIIVVGGAGFAVRETSPNSVNSCGKIEFEE